MSVLGDSKDLPVFITRGDRILPGVRRIVNVATPGVSAEWSVNVPGGVLWRILGGSWTLTTDANVANRSLNLQVTYGGVLIYAAFNASAIVASGSGRAVAMDAYNPNLNAGPSGIHAVQRPTDWLDGNCVIGSNNTGLQAADQYSSINLWVSELYATEQVLSEWSERELEALRAT